MNESKLTIALVQFDIKWNDKRANLKKIESLLTAKEALDLVVLPEMFATGFDVSNTNIIEPASDSPTLLWMIKSANRLNCAFVGSIAVADGDKNFNRLYFVFPDGTYRYYNKRHLFQLSNEPLLFNQGDAREVVCFRGWKMALSVCYDLRFPIWLRNAYIDSDFEYDILLNVASWPASRIPIWNHLLSARAIENLCYVVGVNRIGIDNFGVACSGNSQVCSLNGDPILEANETEGCFIVHLLKHELVKARTDFNVALDWDSFKLVL